MSDVRDEMIGVVLPILEKCYESDWNMTYSEMVTDTLIKDGYRKIFDGDCGLSTIKDPGEREAAEAWMRWANIVSGNDGNGVAAMRQMLTEFGYSKPRTISAVEGLVDLGAKSVILDGNGTPLVCDGDAAQPWASVCEDLQGGPIWLDSADVTLPATVLYEPTA